MKTLESAFLEAIIENPADDTPRLVFADWLLENGKEERAEFIRVQCKIALGKPDPKRHIKLNANTNRWERMDYCGQCPHCLLRRRERELVIPNGKFRPHQEWFPQFDESWTFKLAGFSGDVKTPAAFVRRGFVEDVTLPLAGWLAHGPALVRAAPLRTVRLSDYRLYELRSWDGMGWIFTGKLNTLPAEFNSALLVHATEADALAAMSRCCLSWARSQPVS